MFKKGISQVQSIILEVEQGRSLVDILIDSEIRKMWRDIFSPMLKRRNDVELSRM